MTTKNTMSYQLQMILQEARIENEDGEQVLTFAPEGWDRKDFMSINRETLERLMIKAYEAGRASRKR